MGYTHYWAQTRSLTTEEWATFTAAVRDVIAIAKNEGVVIADGLGTPGSDPVINDDFIILNGLDGPDDLAHESFQITRQKGAWDFCKTSHKPYDRVVVACLIVLGKVAPGAFIPTSDGSRIGWGPGLLLAKAARPGWDDFGIPSSIED